MGFAAGLQAGERLGQGILDAYNQSKEQLGIREAKALTAKEVQQREATPDEIGRARAEAQAIAAQDAEMFGLTPQEQVSYAPQMPVQGQRIGLSRYQVGQQSFDRMPTQAEIERAREYAIADVIADRDPARALQMRRELRNQEFEEKQRPLLLNQLEGAIAGQAQQRDLTDLQIKGVKRTDIAAENMNTFNTLFGEANALAQQEGRTLTPTDIAGFAKAAKLSFTQENEVIASQVGRAKSEVEQFRLDVEKLTQGKGLEQLLDLHKNDKRFGDGVHFVQEVDKKTGGYVLARVNEATGQIEERLPFKSKAEATAYLREEAVNPANAAIWLQNYKKTETGIEANRAQIRASDSTVSLNSAKTAQTNAQTKILNMNVEGNEKAKQLQTDLANLDQDDPMFATKQANLIAQFNALNVAPGKTIPMGGTGGKKGSVLQTPVELKKNDDGTYTAYSKDGGMPLYNSYNGEQIPLGMEVDAYKKMKEAAVKNGVGLVTGEDNGRLVLKYAGADGKYYDDPQKAKYAKPTATPPKAEGLDTGTRVVAPTVPTAPTAKPVREPNESFSAFRDRTVAWDRNRMAYDKYMNDQRVQEMLSKNASGLNLNKRPLVDN